MSDYAIFRSGHEAMMFAFNFSSQQYPMSIMAKMMRGMAIGSGRGLSGLDGAAIAGTVKRHVDGLRYPYPAVLRAYYEPNHHISLKDAAELAQHVMGCLPTGAHNRRLVIELVCHYFKIGKKQYLKEIAEKYAVTQSVISRLYSPIKNRLAEWENMARADVDRSMDEAGMIIYR